MFCYCSVCDENYLPHFAALLASVADHAPAAPYILISDRIGTESLATIAAFARDLSVDLEILDGAALDRDGLKVNSYFSPATWLKIYAPDILADRFDRALVIDCDMIVIGDITELVELDLGGADLAAGPDIEGSEKSARLRLELPPEAPYANTGLVLYDLKAWRAAGHSDRVLQYALDNPDRLELADQCAMNAVLWDRMRVYDLKWNVMTNLHDEIPDDPRILHFAGYDKPWRAHHIPGGEFYRYYRDRTPWADPGLPAYPPKLSTRWRHARYHAKCILRTAIGSRRYAHRLAVWRAGTKRMAALRAVYKSRLRALM